MSEEKDQQNLGFDFMDDDFLPGLELEEVPTEVEIEVDEVELDEEETEVPKKEGESSKEDLEEDPEEEEEEEQENEDKTKSKGNTSEKLSLDASTFFEILKEQNLFKLEDDADLSEENIILGLKKATEENAAMQIYDVVTKHQGQNGWKLFQDIFLKGAGKAYLEEHNKQVEIESLDLDSPEAQEAIYREYLKEVTQMPIEEIDEQIEFLKEKNKLASKADFAKSELIKARENNKKLEVQRSADAVEKRKAKEQEYVDSIELTLVEAMKVKEIDGVPLKQDDSRELLPYMVEKKYELPNGVKITEFERDLIELRKDPKTAIKLAKLAKEKLNLSPIEDKGVSKKASFLFKEVQADTKKTVSSSANDVKFDELLKILG